MKLPLDSTQRLMKLISEKIKSTTNKTTCTAFRKVRRTFIDSKFNGDEFPNDVIKAFLISQLYSQPKKPKL